MWVGGGSSGLDIMATMNTNLRSITGSCEDARKPNTGKSPLTERDPRSYHDENTREEDLIHPEDIAHFKKHEMEEDEAWRQEQLDKMTVVDANIPDKFRRRS